MNDGSTDRTKEIVECIALDDNRIKLLNKENGGVGSARNMGLKAATGVYIAWCDADDWVEEDWLENLYDNLIKFDADISICRSHIKGRKPYPTPNAYKIWENDELIPKFIEHTELNGTLWNKLFKRKILDGIDFNESLRYWEDLDFIWSVLKNTNKIVRLYKETYNFVTHEDSLCSSKISKPRLEATEIVWGRIVKDCSSLNENLYQSALLKKCTWDYGGLKLMYRDDYYDSVIENRIRKEIKSNRKLLIKNMSIIDRMFINAIICNVSIARKLYKLKL